MKCKRVYLGTNTKMFMTINQTTQFLKRLHELTVDLQNKNVAIFVIPSYTALDAANKCVSGDFIQLGAQNMFWEDEGPFTGEISPLMLKEVGIKVVEIGHSERRNVFGETDEQENLKVKCALRHGFTPLLCIGESESAKEDGKTDDVLGKQLDAGLHGISPEDASKVWIAYEPVWAIGVSGKKPSPSYVAERHHKIRKKLVKLLGTAVGNSIPVLYGGGVNSENAVELISIDDIDGLFIGRAAWDADNFDAIIRSVLVAVNRAGLL